MQQFPGRPANRERKEDDVRRVNVLASNAPQPQRRNTGDPAKYNLRAEQRRISWENDLYERQSI